MDVNLDMKDVEMRLKRKLAESNLNLLLTSSFNIPINAPCITVSIPCNPAFFTHIHTTRISIHNIDNSSLTNLFNAFYSAVSDVHKQHPNQYVICGKFLISLLQEEAQPSATLQLRSYYILASTLDAFKDKFKDTFKPPTTNVRNIII